MKIAVRYFTRTGNTKKLADAISKAVNTQGYEVSVPLNERVDVLFLGCSYYAFDVDESVKKFIADNKENIGEIVCFGTSAMMKSMKKPIRKVTESLGIAVSEKEFHCRGRFGRMHKDRPDQKDVNNAVEFAKSIIA